LSGLGETTFATEEVTIKTSSLNSTLNLQFKLIPRLRLNT